MTDIVPSPVGPTGNNLLRVLGWMAVLIVFAAAWFALLALVVPARAERPGGAGHVLLTFSPPILMTLLTWIAVRHMTLPSRQAKVEPEPAQDCAVALAAIPYSATRFRLGAFSALTPFGNALETVEGTQSKEKVFQVDRTLSIPGGFPVHAAMVPALPLARLGYPADTRRSAVRIAAMLELILGELHQQQDRIASAIEAPGVVYWLLAPQLTDDGAAQQALAAAWSRSPWRTVKHELHLVRGLPGGAYALIAALQRDIEQSRAPFVLLLAADSVLEPDLLAPLFELEQVFSENAPNGFIPAEGAAGLLLFHPAHSPAGLWNGACQLGPAVCIARPQERKGRKPELASLSTALASALSAAAVAPDSITAIVADSDHRVAGAMEAAAAMTLHTAHLDPLEDRISPMQYAGWFGAATDLIHVALGAELALTREATVGTLAASVDQAAALLILPPPP